MSRTEMSRVPVIPMDAGLDEPGTMAALDAACREWGFFQITEHGIDETLLAATRAQMKAFFALPVAEKRAIARSAENPWGFYDQELTKNTRDWKEVFDVGPAETEGPMAGASPQWPEALPELKAVLITFSTACEELAQRILAAISTNLSMPPGYLGEAFRPTHTSFLRLNYYPACDEPAPPDAPSLPTSGHLGVNQHTDAGALTVLLQDEQPGLQVYRADQWHTVEPHPHALVINIGDIVQVWSNDRYRAPLHRVVADSRVPRYSAPYFFNPTYSADYGPLPGVCTPEDPPRYRSINWGEFRAARSAGDYADYGEEIQISQFRI